MNFFNIPKYGTVNGKHFTPAENIAFALLAAQFQQHFSFESNFTHPTSSQGNGWKMLNIFALPESAGEMQKQRAL